MSEDHRLQLLLMAGLALYAFVALIVFALIDFFNAHGWPFIAGLITIVLGIPVMTGSPLAGVIALVIPWCLLGWACQAIGARLRHSS